MKSPESMSSHLHPGKYVKYIVRHHWTPDLTNPVASVAVNFTMGSMGTLCLECSTTEAKLWSLGGSLFGHGNWGIRSSDCGYAQVVICQKQLLHAILLVPLFSSQTRTYRIHSSSLLEAATSSPSNVTVNHCWKDARQAEQHRQKDRMRRSLA